MIFIKNIYYYLKFIRPITFIGTFVVISCISLVAININPYVPYSWLIILIGSFSCSFLTLAAYTLNNICDLEIDKINKPFRPLSANLISIKEAWMITIFLYLISIILSLFINITFFVLILIMFFLTIMYSVPPFSFKKNSILSNFTISLCRGLLIILAGWVLVRDIDYILPWYIGFILFLFLFGAISTKDITDIKGDKQNNCFTLPVKYDFDKFIKIISPFFILPFLLIPLGVYLKILNINTLPLTLLLFYGIYIIWLMKNKINKTTKIEGNHIAWKHTYILYMIFNIGILLAYII